MSVLLLEKLVDKALDATATALKQGGYSSDPPWVTLLPELKNVVATTFDANHRAALDGLRNAVKKAQRSKETEGDFLCKGAGIVSPRTATNLLSPAQVSRSASLKLLRHTYYYAHRGTDKLWIVSLPESYGQWPHKYLAGTIQQAYAKLEASEERFSDGDRKKISEANQRGLGWVHKALIALDDVGDKSKTLPILKRWFADEDTTTTALKSFAQRRLREGLKKIAAKMSGGTLIVTDFVPMRQSTDAGDINLLNSNAFVWADSRDVIYIEKPFFSHASTSVFQKDSRHWARIMVHEMRHRVVDTEDECYACAGIKPSKRGLTSARVMNNADSWAIFVADAAGAMSKTDIAHCTNGTVD